MNKIEKISMLIEEDYILGLSLVRNVNEYDSSLEHLEYYDMDEFNSYTEFMTHDELVRRIYYGKGFNPRDTFFRFDGYENLESCSQWKVKKEILDSKEEIADRVLELWGLQYFNIYEEKVIEILEN